MPAYEVMLLLRKMSTPELTASLKRISTAILDRRGIIRSMENLGHRPTPYKMSSNGLVHREASCFTIKFDSTIQTKDDLRDEYSRDVDVIKHIVFTMKDDEKFECKLDEEIQPPVYRKEVQEMIKHGKKQQNPFTQVFKYNSGLNYYPFQK